jgi:hypothetical protein
MGWSPGEVTDSEGRLISVEQRSKNRVELSIIGASKCVWSTLDEKNATELLNQLVLVCNASFGKSLRVEED